jgi:hypothetical protein
MNSPLTNVAYTFVNNSANAVANAAANAVPNTGINWILWLSVIALTMVVAGFFVWYWDLLKPAAPHETVSLKPVVATDTSVLLEAPERKMQESWCFIGEDKTGRWCLRVPTSHACDPDRTYTSQADCELVTASEMPLGFLKNGGVSSMPLSAIPVMSNTEVV